MCVDNEVVWRKKEKNKKRQNRTEFQGDQFYIFSDLPDMQVEARQMAPDPWSLA